MHTTKGPALIQKLPPHGRHCNHGLLSAIWLFNTAACGEVVNDIQDRRRCHHLYTTPSRTGIMIRLPRSARDPPRLHQRVPPRPAASPASRLGFRDRLPPSATPLRYLITTSNRSSATSPHSHTQSFQSLPFLVIHSLPIPPTTAFPSHYS